MQAMVIIVKDQSLLKMLSVGHKLLVGNCLMIACLLLLSSCAVQAEKSIAQKPSLLHAPLKKFHPNMTHMSVLMPGSPSEMKDNSADSRKFSCEDDDACFSVAEQNIDSYDLHDQKHLQASLDRSVNQAISAMHGAPNKIAAVSLAGDRYPGREAEGTLPTPFGEDGQFRIRIYFDVSRKKMYCIGIIGFSKEVYGPNVASFLDSLEVN
ncbi:MAG: hypothetical protein P4L53_14930 [Candidatus Obscuribacterales bacterium]|nr:hypothetical protein [Candidatus Obscuribacterales bacterium]